MKTAAAISPKDRVLGSLWGSLVGDALGVPVEFKDRATVQLDPVTSMREYGTHKQPRGTWSDDSSMLLCTADSLLNHEYSLTDMGGRFVRWMNEGLWTAHGDVFDMGGTTCTALMRITKGIPADEAGGRHEDSNGNGSLMRILPAVLRFAIEPLESFSSRVEKVSAITHAHARSRMACVFYGLMIRQLLLGWQPQDALASPFNNQYVDAVMARFGVLPLNNPPHFPRYNGAEEKGIRDLKAALDRRYQVTEKLCLSSQD
jgi:ADP-ribosylglycohydrolase